MKQFLNFKSEIQDGSVIRDCERIVDVLNSKGYIIDVSNALTVWEKHSESFAASWLILPEFDEVLWADLRYFIEEECLWEEVE